MYERSYMHRDVVDHVVVTKTGFVLTLSADGHVKFWKRRNEGIEFVKDFRAHIGPITAYAASPDGQMFATTSTDKKVKIFDVVNFDMIGIIAIDCLPAVLCWVIDPLDQTICIAVSGVESPVVYTYDPYADTKPKRTINSPHRQPLQLMAYNRAMQCIVSVDKGGMIEYWSLDKPGELPAAADFKLKSQTDLYEFKKSKCVPNSIVFSHDFSLFVCTCSGDSIVRVFQASSGKLFRKYDESINASNAIQTSDESTKFKLDDMEFGRRLVVESELLKSSAGQKINAVFDESGKFLLLASLFGIKIVSLTANKVVRVLGKTEPYRFVNIALVQGSSNDEKARLEMTTPSSSGANAASDPIIFCTAFKRNRFYMFTRSEPDYTTQNGDRDVFNEKPTREEVSLAMAPVKKQIAKSAILRTTLGDIRLALFPEHAPKAVENFVVHSRSGFYNGVIFHRVIKRFMIQTGDPLGDGTGGESIWGRPFEDEFTPSLRHNLPYTLSMANSGPGTNGSQFFITTVESAPWLDDKHTIFGRVLAGADVVRLIEAAKTDKHDKPLDDISILNIQINHNE
ncbi:peptidyl-prolyl cis-trans isomerase cyp15 [Coemansia reversa NRRL 1564]|uniref:peptidylprolyl isomerase n=1 Tax=Coemansia reversa (strain ATCC 12441 / NRRL 1564) TaxID=763665 RepID=A0A2G5BGP7_COERN|nr:peptidyl-prolyl cis-trans isomerase cyp15 [Coemansia reversa NRRL 1564]|eukprot:PIA18196.1 peptidyl-prolyl cis-trans isomerase cyp15 [Coemansia reversa NRRL 1564]